MAPVSRACSVGRVLKPAAIWPFLLRDHLPDKQIVQYLKILRGQGRDASLCLARRHAGRTGGPFNCRS